MAKATGQVPPSATSFPLSTTFRIETGQVVGDGGYLASAFEFSIDTNSEGGSDVTIGEATVTLGAFVFGLADSRFDFWAGDEFAFIDRIPSRTVALIGYERQLTETISLSLSVEDVSADRRTALPAAGSRVPDGVARLLYEQGGLTVHGAVAVREVPRIGASSLVGRAAIIGATWEGEAAGAANDAYRPDRRGGERSALYRLAARPACRLRLSWRRGDDARLVEHRFDRAGMDSMNGRLTPMSAATG